MTIAEISIDEYDDGIVSGTLLLNDALAKFSLITALDDEDIRVYLVFADTPEAFLLGIVTEADLLDAMNINDVQEEELA